MISQRNYPTYAAYVMAVLLSTPDEYPETFGYYQAGVWLAEGQFTLDDGTLPTLEPDDYRTEAFWNGYRSVTSQSKRQKT